MPRPLYPGVCDDCFGNDAIGLSPSLAHFLPKDLFTDENSKRTSKQHIPRFPSLPCSAWYPADDEITLAPQPSSVPSSDDGRSSTTTTLKDTFEKSDQLTDDPEAVALKVREENLTTLMLRNIPNRFTVSELAGVLDSMGFEGTYDLCLLPIDPHSGHGKGYCFVNFTEAAAAAAFCQVGHMHMFERGGKYLTVSAARLQGKLLTLEQHHKGKHRKVRLSDNKALLLRGPSGSSLQAVSVPKALQLVRDAAADSA